MKTKVDKKGKKRSLSETSLSTKLPQKQENVVESKKSPKKAKLATSVQNGDSTTRNKVQILKKMYKQEEKQKTKQINIGQSLKAKKKTEKTKLPIAELKEESVSKTTKTKENKLKNLKKKQAKRELHKKRRRGFVNAASITLSIEEIEAKIEEIRNREVLSKRAKRILSALNRKLKYEKSANNSEKLNVTEKKSDKKNEDQTNALAKIKQELKEDNEEKIKVKEENVQHEEEDRIKKENTFSRNIYLYMRHNELKSELDDSGDQDDSEDDENESDEDESDEDISDEDIDEKANMLKGKKHIKKMEKQSLGHQKKNQYILFVSNFSLKMEEDELKRHFLTKVDTVAKIMMPRKSDLCYGFAFVEFTNRADFKKGLSMNHSLLKGRPLKVKVLKRSDKEINIVKNHVMAKNEELPVFKKAKKINLGQNQQKKKLLKKGK